MFLFNLVVLFSYVLSGYCADLPSYIVPCHRSDPDLVNCVLNHGTDVISHIIPGDKQYGIPPMNPLKIELIDIDSGPNLKLLIKDLAVNGLETAKFINNNPHIDNIRIDLTFDYLELIGTYEINGHILILPIKGTGPMNIYFGKTNASVSFKMDTVEKNGKKYFTAPDLDLTITHDSAKMQFDNLFNGDKALGDQTNKFINENWREVLKEISPSINYVIKTIVLKIINGFASKIPADLVFPE